MASPPRQPASDEGSRGEESYVAPKREPPRPDLDHGTGRDSRPTGTGGSDVSDEADAMLIFGGGASGPSAEGVRRGLRERLETGAGEASRVAVATIQENMRRFLDSLDAILTASPKAVGGLTLDEVEISAQIDGKGNVGLWGIGGTEIAAHGGLKFVLRKKG